jgi:hypothetical protein
VAVLVVMATSQGLAQRLNPGIFPATSSPYDQTYGQCAAAWEFVRGTSFHRRCLGIKAIFLPLSYQLLPQTDEYTRFLHS